MSEIKVNKLTPRTNCGTVQLGDSGDTITIPAGATITNNGTQTGFGRTGTVNWETTAITADPNPAVSGTGYFVNTTSGAITITLPTSPAAGDIVAFADYALTWDTNNLTLDPGSNKINGDTTDYTVSSEGKSLTLVYTDSTQGWKVVNDGNSNVGVQSLFITATGGTVTCCGDYKIHTFTGPGTFCVSCGGNAAGSNSVDYLVVAGGGGGGLGTGAGAGAGGYRTTFPSPAGTFPVSATTYPITVGSGGAGAGPTRGRGTSGSDSIFSSITSAGGGGGGGQNPGPGSGNSGGSGGGSVFTPCISGNPGGAGNTPPVSPPQGNPGGDGHPSAGSGGGGGAGAAGTNASAPTGGPGGNGLPNSITGSAVTYGGGGGGGHYNGVADGTGGAGGGGAGISSPTGAPATPGTANTGGGGGGSSDFPTQGGTGGSGGSGIVIIRYKYQ
jgi:hypothetical protein